MGLNNSKMKHKVRKVMPLESKEVSVPPAPSGINGRHSMCHVGSIDPRSPSSERQLPPLRETLYGRGAIESRPISFEVPLDGEDTSSIIKKHPPRRLQKLEPLVLPSIMSDGSNMSNPEGASARKGKQQLERKVTTAIQSTGRRQHNQKLQMLEIKRKQEEAEIKRNIHREAKINKHKMREIKAKKVRENAMRCHEDEVFLPVEHDETFNVDHGNTYDWPIRNFSSTPDCHLWESKLKMWFQPQDRSESNDDTSSSDSLDSWIRKDANSRRPALIRTRTEKIPTFDEFFDHEF